ncbi:MAG: carboxylesterase family protein [Clostridia bacterium]|nr:carboxylesterase family protein [Clostridia bacterium]
MKEVIKTTPCGEIKGIENERCLEFRGIRYATAARYEMPVEVTNWEGTYDATAFGACCYQHRAFEEDAVVNPFYHIEFRKGVPFTYSEDCLFLNIWAPKNAENCPVLVFIHGGSFTGGSADEAHIKGERFAEKGIITVAMNYRLGPYGFCAHKDFCDENGSLANYGLYDQTTAIEWVLHNIAAFGGDPESITLMGQSAGAMSVDIHLNNPALAQRFKGAIMLSGSGLQRCLIKPLSIEKITPFWDKVMEFAGVSTFGGLKSIGAQKLYYAWKKACKQYAVSLPYTFPVYDGKVLDKARFSLQSLPDMPYIIGSTCTDMVPIVLEGVDRKWGKYVQMHHQSPCWFYNFNRWLPGDDMGAWHSADLLYVFSTLENNWRPFEETDYIISEQLSDAVSAFVKTGNPNCAAIPPWKADYRTPLSFAEHTASGKWHTMDNIQFTLTSKGKTI